MHSSNKVTEESRKANIDTWCRDDFRIILAHYLIEAHRMISDRSKLLRVHSQVCSMQHSF